MVKTVSFAMKHVYLASHPGEAFDMRVYRGGLRERCPHAAGRYFPHEMSIKMLIKSLDRVRRVQHMAVLFWKVWRERMVV